MRSIKTRRFAYAAAALLALSATSAFAGGVLTVGNPFAPVSMDPAFSGNGRAGTFLMPAYEPLLRTRPEGGFEPALAQSWSVSPDNREATFTLRKDARFSDGEPVTAAAAKLDFAHFRRQRRAFR